MFHGCTFLERPGIVDLKFLVSFCKCFTKFHRVLVSKSNKDYKILAEFVPIFFNSHKACCKCNIFLARLN